MSSSYKSGIQSLSKSHLSPEKRALIFQSFNQVWFLVQKLIIPLFSNERLQRLYFVFTLTTPCLSQRDKIILSSLTFFSE